MTEVAAEIRFLQFRGSPIAFGVSGAGRPLVAAAWWVSHLELDWQDDAFRSFWGSVASGSSLVRYDHPGFGLSGRDLAAARLTLDDQVDLLRAIMDELRLERVSLMGGSSGGCAAIAFAARFPERVDRLLLYGAYAQGRAIAPAGVRDAMVTAVRSHWGLGSRMLAEGFLGDAATEERERFVRRQRASADAETAAALLELTYELDVRAELARVQAPTQIVHRRGDRAIPHACGRELAASIPGATLVTLEGTAHLPWVGDRMSVARALGAFLSAAPSPDPAAAMLLSRREREVLSLIALGLSDREIAERMIVSPHTVHRHVANIRRKLGSNSRAAAIAEAARVGLL